MNASGFLYLSLSTVTRCTLAIQPLSALTSASVSVMPQYERGVIYVDRPATAVNIKALSSSDY